MKFGEALELLRDGKVVTRKSWNDSKVIIKQVPCNINSNIIPNMQSLPIDAKEVLLSNELGIKYRNQILVVNSDHIADSYTPSADDLFAEDWIRVAMESGV